MITLKVGQQLDKETDTEYGNSITQVVTVDLIICGNAVLSDGVLVPVKWKRRQYDRFNRLTWKITTYKIR